MMHLARAGTADITGSSKDCRFIAIECKIRPNKRTTLQKAYLAEIRKRGDIAIVTYQLRAVEAVL